MTLFESLLGDSRHAVRQLAARPAFTLVVLVMLTVGIGVNTSAFSIIYALVARPLPFSSAEAIVSVGRVVTGGFGIALLSGAEFRRLADESRSFEAVAAYAPADVAWNGELGPVSLVGAAVTPAFFEVLETVPRLGRVFDQVDATEGGPQVALLSHRLWSNRLGSRSGIIGTAIELNNQPYTVIGVLPERFDFPFPDTDVWTPLVIPSYGSDADEATRRHFGIARLRPDVSAAQATAEIRTILNRTALDEFARSTAVEPSVVSLRELRTLPLQPAFVVLIAATGLLLLLVCANVGGMLLSRGVVRRQEFAIRAALGASRSRLVRQLVTESILLSGAGGAIGVVAAAGIVHAAPGMIPIYVPGLDEARLDGEVLAFAAGCSVAAGLLFGTAPALTWSRVDLSSTLNEGGVVSGSTSIRAQRANAVLAAGQVSLACVFLIGAGLLLRSFVALSSIDLGLNPTNVVVGEVGWSPLPVTAGPHSGPEELEAWHAAEVQRASDLLTRLERITDLPGVQAAALSSAMPLSSAFLRSAFRDAGASPSDPRQRLQADIRSVSAGYADVLQLRLQAGRFLTARDGADAPPVAVVSESLARQAFGEGPAIGRQLASSVPSLAWGGANVRDEVWQVVGVVADVATPLGGTTPSTVYLSMLQPSSESALTNTLVVSARSEKDPAAVIPFLNEMLSDMYPTAQVWTYALETPLAARAALPSFLAACAGVFGAGALFLASFSLYGIISYNVFQRRREIGIRRALGAERGAILGLVVRQGAALIGTGLAFGVAGATVGAGVVESILYGVESRDPLTFAAIAAVLGVVSLLACWLPARQATRIAPMDVLKGTQRG